jgi:hypothetical protein
MRIGRGVRLGQEPHALLVGPQHHFKQAFGSVGCFLGQAADAPAGRKMHIAAIENELPGNRAEQRGLADAVASDQTDVRAGRHLRTSSVQELPLADFDHEVVEHEHGGYLADRAARGNGMLRGCGTRDILRSIGD